MWRDYVQTIAHVLDLALSADRKIEDIHEGAIICSFLDEDNERWISVLVIDCYGTDPVDETEALTIALDYLYEFGSLPKDYKPLEEAHRITGFPEHTRKRLKSFMRGEKVLVSTDELDILERLPVVWKQLATRKNPLQLGVLDAWEAWLK